MGFNPASSGRQLSDANAFTLYDVGSNVDLSDWNAGGTTTHLGVVGPIPPDYAGYAAELLTLYWPWALASYWTVPAGAVDEVPTLTFCNAQTGATLTPTPPVTAISSLAQNLDFYLSPTSFVLYCMVDLSFNRGTNPNGIDIWSPASNQITPSARESLAVRSSDRRHDSGLAKRAGADWTGPYDLISYIITTASESTLSNTMSQFKLADGLLVWAESGSNTTLIKAVDGATVTRVSSLTPRISGERVVGTCCSARIRSSIFGAQLQAGSGYSMRFPEIAQIWGKTVYFINGTQQLL